MFIESLASRKVWNLKDSQAVASHWKDGKTLVGLGVLAAPIWKFPIRYLVEVAFVPGVQG